MVTRPGVVLRALAPADEAAWAALFARYARFYATRPRASALRTTWEWLMAADGPLRGVVAADADGLLGLAHYRSVPESLQGRRSCFLDDLFVHPRHRQRGIGEALVREVARQAQQAGLRPLQWATARDNLQARRLYDRLATATDWVIYALDVQRGATHTRRP